MKSINLTSIASVAVAGTLAVTNPSTKAPQREGGVKFSLPVLYPQDHHTRMPEYSRNKRTLLGTAPLVSNTMKSTYMVAVQIGNPPKGMFLELDTGSSDLWVASNLLPTDNRPKNGPIYTINDNDIRLDNSYFYADYLSDDTATGPVYLEPVSIGEITVDKQAVGMAKDAKGNLFEEYSGILGLAMDSEITIEINGKKDTSQQTWFSRIKTQLLSPIFAIDIKRDKPGQFDVGFTDPMAYIGDFIYTKHLDDRGMWDISVSGFSISNGPRKDSAVTRATVDSGTVYLELADEAIVQEYYASFDATWDTKSEVWVFPCNANVPDFSFWLSDNKVTIPASVMNRGQLYYHNDVACYGGLIFRDIGEHTIGQVALQALYVVFDASEAKQVGFAYKNL